MYGASDPLALICMLNERYHWNGIDRSKVAVRV